MRPDWEIGSLACKNEGGKYKEMEIQITPNHDQELLTQQNEKATSGQPEKSTKYLDGVRGLAALLVYIYHFNVGWYGEEILHGFTENGYKSFPLLPFIRTFYTGGPAAVAIFFVLSGFVLTVSPLQKMRNAKSKEVIRTSLLSSAIRRPIRLYLPCLLFLWTYAILRHTALIPVFEWPPLQTNAATEIIAATRQFLEFFNPFRMHTVHYPFAYGVHNWTIPIELKGSMLVFALSAIFASEYFPAREMMKLSIGGILFHQFGQWTMSLFTFGMCLALCHVSDLGILSIPGLTKWAHLEKQVNWTIFFIGWYLCSQVDRNAEWSAATFGWKALTYIIPQVYLDDEYFRYWLGYGAVLMTYAILRINPLQQFFSSRPLLWLGKISFVLYLSHTVILVIVGDWCKRMVGQPTFWILEELGTHWYDNIIYMPNYGPMGLNLRWAACIVITAIPCLGFAHCMTPVYDEFSVKLANATAKKVFKMLPFV